MFRQKLRRLSSDISHMQPYQPREPGRYVTLSPLCGICAPARRLSKGFGCAKGRPSGVSSVFPPSVNPRQRRSTKPKRRGDGVPTAPRIRSDGIIFKSFPIGGHLRTPLHDRRRNIRLDMQRSCDRIIDKDSLSSTNRRHWCPHLLSPRRTILGKQLGWAHEPLARLSSP
jgi:hypothetical protein